MLVLVLARPLNPRLHASLNLLPTNFLSAKACCAETMRKNGSKGSALAGKPLTSRAASHTSHDQLYQVVIIPTVYSSCHSFDFTTRASGACSCSLLQSGRQSNNQTGNPPSPYPQAKAAEGFMGRASPSFTLTTSPTPSGIRSTVAPTSR